ncbi:MAG: hypothetical protein HY779_03460 [Rubrobacteridae bacterium]|nr:hypothetical protein [Rubrobacteridae bacterium]
MTDNSAYNIIANDNDSAAISDNADGTPENNAQDKAVKSLSVIVLTAIIVIYELGLVVVVALLKPIESFTILGSVTTLLVNAIIFLLNSKRPFAFIEKFKSWAERKQAKMNPITAGIVSTSKVAGVVLSTLLVGPIPAAILVDALGFKRPNNYLLATFSGLFFCLLWVAVYNGGIAMTNRLIDAL